MFILNGLIFFLMYNEYLIFHILVIGNHIFIYLATFSFEIARIHDVSFQLIAIRRKTKNVSTYVQLIILLYKSVEIIILY